MNIPTRLFRRTRLVHRPVLVAIAAALVALLNLSFTAAAPRSAPSRAPVVAAPLTGPSCSPSCDLYAVSGTMPAASLPGAPAAGVPVWGYKLPAGGGTPTTVSAPGGPTLIVNQGDAVSIILHNVGIPTATSLMIGGQPGVPDTTGVTMGNAKTYSFPANTLLPGTYLYEAGLTPNGPRQAAMGLYGVLIVRPTGAPAQAYASPSTAFDDEAVVLLSEIDPAFNNAWATYDTSNYTPTFWLINGKVYPQTDSIATDVGRKVLLRYVNAGLKHHSMSLLGLHQTIVATDAQPPVNQSRVVAETIPTGGTLDTIVTMPASAPASAKYALFEAAMHEDNTGASTGGVINFGGMMTFLTIGTGATAPAGPVTSSVSLTSNPSNGSANVALSAVETASGGANVTAAEYFIDTLGASGGGTSMAGAFGSPAVNANASLSVAQLATLSSGTHTFYVHGQDSNGVWGAFASGVLNLDKAGPAIGNLVLTPSASNGTTSVQIQATASDVATGNQNVAAAEYNIDGGLPTAFTVAPATVVSLAASIPVAVVNGLAQGTHQVNIRAQDALGNWGAVSTLNLVVDKTAPNATSVSTGPAGPTNGTFGVQFGTGSNGNLFYQRVDATITDPVSGGVSSNVVAAEYFFDTDPGVGKAASMDPADGSFNSTSEAVVFPVPIVTVAALADGTHTIYVRGKDAAGNWSPTGSITLVVDKTSPTVSTLALSPNVLNSGTVAINTTATDPLFAGVHSNIIAAEYFIDAIGGVGTGTPLTVNTPNATSTGLSATIPAATIAALSSGAHTVYVRAEDAATNWSALVSASLTVDRTPPTFSGITLAPTSIVAVTTSVNLTVNGASDGTAGSGVAGGEYWICSLTCTNPAPGSGTAFAIPGTVTIPTAALAGGQQYTVRARIRDGVGNWSTGGNGIRSAVLTVTPANNIFTDGFESGSLLGNWTSRSTTTASRLNVTTGAALFGADGLQAQGNNTNYVQYNFGTVANPVAAIYDARFSFNPNNNASTGQDIFAAATTSTFGTTLFHVRYRLNGAQPQVQIQVGNTANASWVNITNNTGNSIEVVWQSGGTLALYLNGATTASQSLAAGAGSVGAVRLGSVTSGGSATLEYFDAFASKRSASPLIGL